MLDIEAASQLHADGDSIDAIMHEAASPYKVEEMHPQPVDFFCRWSRKRFVNTLAMLSLKELEEIREEGQELVCHFCNAKYYVGQNEIDELYKQKKTRLN